LGSARVKTFACGEAITASVSFLPGPVLGDRGAVECACSHFVECGFDDEGNVASLERQLHKRWRPMADAAPDAQLVLTDIEGSTDLDGRVYFRTESTGKVA
jgi:hypothetical protein